MAAIPPVPVPPVVPPPPLTVLNGIVACGFSNVIQVNAGNTSPAQRVASQLYFDSFAMCLTLTDKQIDNAFKAFSDLTIADGRVKVMPGLITKVKAFTQHVAHLLRLQMNPEDPANAFDPTQTVMLTKQRVHQVKFESDNKSEIEGAKPAIFSTTTVWIEWNRAFYNYLKLIQTANNECDTNADTCCLGQNFRIMSYTSRVADVYAYDKSIKPIENVPIVSGATAWTDPATDTTYLLIFHESLYYGPKLDHSLINPNQVRDYGIGFWDNPYDKSKGINIDLDEATIQLRTMGTKIYFETRAPTDQELATCPRIDMTSPHQWNPTSVSLKSVSTNRAPKRRISEIQTDNTIRFEYSEYDSDETLLHSVAPSFTDLKTQMQEIVARNSAHYELQDLPTRQTYTSTERHKQATAEVLADRFGIGLQRARQTIKVTTQRGVRSAILPISRRYRADRMFNVKELNGRFATDTLWSKTRSLNGNICSQVYTHKNGFSACYHMRKADNDNVGNSLKGFVNDFGKPEHLTYDGAAVQVGRGTEFQKSIRKYEIKTHVSAPRRPNENPAEGCIREIKRRFYRMQAKHKVPDRLWDYLIQYVCETGNIIANNSKYADGRSAMEIITGDTPDISEYIDFGFYDWVTFRANAGMGDIEIGRWLGVSHRIGQLMSYWILPESGIPISCTTVQRVTNLERSSDEFKRRMREFDDKIESKLNASSAAVDVKGIRDIDPALILSLDEEDAEFREEFGRVISNDDIKHAEDITAEEIGVKDPYIGMELGMPIGAEDTMHATVKRRAVGEDGKAVGYAHNNPMMDSRAYEVEFMDGHIETLTANIIAENLLAQVDDEGHRHLLIDEIEGHRKTDDAIPKSQGTYSTRAGMVRNKRTTRGWQFYVRWKDGSADWIELKDVKESYPVPLADYAIANNIQDEPAFAWWVPYVIRKRKAIVQKIKSKYWQKTHKYGIRVPKTVREAADLDRKNGDSLWMDSIRLEMKNNRVAFETYNGDIKDLIGYVEITGHLVFDVKLAENFRRKARFCADGHKVDSPPFLTYSTVVARDSVRIILMVAALNDLDIQGADIQNAFLSAPNREKHYMKAGPEFGAEQGKTFLVVRALYGLKSAGASFRAFMAKKLDEIGFKSSVADPDVWLRPALKGDGTPYYEYVLMYVDDILAVSTNAVNILKSLEGDTVRYKNDKIEPPTMYLGGKLQRKNLNDGEYWTITSVDYVKAAVETIKTALKERVNWKLPTKVTTPMSSNYVPELDDTPELNPDDIQFYQEMMGMLRWATELGRVDILHEISILSQYQASPRQGHMQEALHVFAYLDKRPKLTLYMNSEEPSIEQADFKANPEEFMEYYRDAEEQLPHRMPEPRGNPVITLAYCDASYAANKKTRKSHSGYVIFVNKAPVKWVSRRQNTMETSAFSAEFIALKQCIEDIEHLRFKLRMFGVPISDNQPATYIYCDNDSVVKNSSRVDSTLNKKHSEVAYHFTRWNVTAQVCTIGWIETEYNIADAFTKRLAEKVRDFLFGEWTF